MKKKSSLKKMISKKKNLCFASLPLISTLTSTARVLATSEAGLPAHSSACHSTRWQPSTITPGGKQHKPIFMEIFMFDKMSKNYLKHLSQGRMIIPQQHYSWSDI